MDTLLWPLKVSVAWVMVTIHKGLVFIGFPDGPGIAWVLSIIGLTIVVRLLIMPLFVKQIRASRGMQLMQPELQALQAKYKGKKDPASQKKMQEEIDYLEGFLASVMKKLGNEKFVAHAKPEVVANERKKQADAESKLKTLRENVEKLKGRDADVR